MKILFRERLVSFCGRHADAREWIQHWIADAEAAAWGSPHDIRKSYASASFLGNGLVIFNVKGNAYRLEVRVHYGARAVAIEWAGTHADYDQRNRKR